MFSPESIEYTKSDVLQVTIVTVVAHVIRQTIQDKELFANEWLISTGGLLLGLVVHGLLVKSINKKLKLAEPYKTAVADSLRLITMLLVQKIVKDLASTGSMNFTNIDSWLKSTGLMVAGVLVYDMLFGMILPKFVKDRTELTDTIKLSIPLIFNDFVPDFDLEHDTVKSSLSTFAGVSAYHMIMRK
jgi:dipeptide/tripeptide permease